MLLNDLELVPDIGHSNGRDEQLQAAGKSTGELVVDLSWLKAMAGQKRPPIQPVNRCRVILLAFLETSETTFAKQWTTCTTSRYALRTWATNCSYCLRCGLDPHAALLYRASSFHLKVGEIASPVPR
jgi:hypothetical protein